MSGVLKEINNIIRKRCYFLALRVVSVDNVFLFFPTTFAGSFLEVADWGAGVSIKRPSGMVEGICKN